MNERPATWLLLLAFPIISLSPASAQQPPFDPPQSGEKRTEHDANHLADESSPYLLQHAHNPVDWYPWGDEALQKAKRENKLIFLSIGYAACHWCHVMERESFEDEEIANSLNERFVCIKVDREERPDVDQIYMTAVQLISGQGGWPLSVFLTPDAKPFWGGTYLPARDGDRGNATGFLTVLTKIHDLWEESPQLVRQQAATVTQAIRSNQPEVASEEGDAKAETRLPGRPEVQNVAEELAAQFDPEFGGFGFSSVDPSRPKFPEPSNLLFLLARAQDPSLGAEERGTTESMLIKTLNGMLSGAMHDHVGGGFHRYSVDRQWQIPHFEKMLYDNGQLATVYAEAGLLFDRDEYRRTAERICDFVLRELRAPAGAFYSSLDADSEGEEGKYYRWRRAEIAELEQRKIPGFDVAQQVFGFSRQPNFEEHFWVPAPGDPLTSIAKQRGISYRELVDQLTPTRLAMLELRRKRVPPATDLKILTAWNGLIIKGLSDCGRLLERDEYITAAKEAADFLIQKLRSDEGRLLRSYARGQAKLDAYLDDYAFLASGLLALHRATGEETWLTHARELVDRQLDLFWDADGGGFFFTASDAPTLIVRLRDPIDGALPSGTSVSLENLKMLYELTNEEEYHQRYVACLKSLKPLFDQIPAGLPRAAATLVEPADDTAGN